jgi:transformation/transcription domain-associated protein
MLVECLQSYVLHTHDVSYLFDLLHVFDTATLVDYHFLKLFYGQTMSHVLNTRAKTAVVEHFLTLFVTPSVKETVKIHALQLIILPLFMSLFRTTGTTGTTGTTAAATATLPPDICNAIVSSLLTTTVVYSDGMRIQLLKMATLLITHLPTVLVGKRKEL